jgi:tetratricopeptide (TPR) repeat protein
VAEPYRNAPTFGNLSKLAELYECAVSDLLVDLPDFRHLDKPSNTQEAVQAIPETDVELIVPSDVAAWVSALGRTLPEKLVTSLMQHLKSLASSDRGMHTTPRDRDHAYHQFVQFLRRWAHIMDRLDVLRILAWGASASSVFSILSSDEQQRMASVLSRSSRVDAQTIEHIEAVLWHCRQQDWALGPQAALDTVLAQRNLARVLMPECPAVLQPRMLSVLSEASRQAGWLSYDLKQFENAGYYYEDARTLAHEAKNTALATFVLCQMSQLATWRGRPRIGIDHAVAAQWWVHQTGDLRLRAFAADMAARAYATDRQRNLCLTALDIAHTALTAAGDQSPDSVIPFYGEALHISFRGECYLKLGEADPAVSYGQQSLQALDQSHARAVALTIVDLGEAYVLCNEVDEAARLFGDAGDIAAVNSSARLIGRLKQACTSLQPWQHTPAVRTLDERLASYGLA